MKRFYKLVTVTESDGGYAVHLDGKPVNTPAGKSLVSPTMALAEAIAAEWRSQEETINPNAMPLTQLLITTLDRVSADRAAITDGVLRYLDTDLLCYRTDNPQALGARQAELRDPWLKWFGAQAGAELSVTTSLSALSQPEAAHHYLKEQARALPAPVFCVFQLLTALSGSVILALAFIRRDIGEDQFYDAVMAEEHFKAELYDEEKYGAAPHEEKKHADLREEIKAARHFLDLLR